MRATKPLLVVVAALVLTTVFSGCEPSRPVETTASNRTPLEQDVAHILNELLPVDARRVSCNAASGFQTCSILFRQQAVFAKIALLGTESPLVFTATSKGGEWTPGDIRHEESLLARLTGNLDSPAPTAGEFRRRVLECVSRSLVRR